MKRRLFIPIAFLIALVISLPFWAISYTYTLDADGIIQEFKYTYNDDVALPDVTKQHFIFTGWIDEHGNKVKSFSKSLGDKKFVAMFTPETYKIKIAEDENGYSYEAGRTFTLPVLKKDFYEFKGYQIKDTQKIIFDTDGLYQDLDLIPIYEPETYTLSLNPDGGILSANYPDSYVYGSTVKLPSASKDGYSFLGWYLDEGLTKPFYFVEGTYGNLTLYAGFKKIEDFPYMGSYGAIKVGSYKAAIEYASSYGGYESVIDRQNVAAYDVNLGGSLFIYDHNYQGFSQTQSNDSLQIKFSDGTVRTYTKYETHYGSLASGISNDGVSIWNVSVPLITQTCTSGDGIVWCFWK